MFQVNDSPFSGHQREAFHLEEVRVDVELVMIAAALTCIGPLTYRSKSSEGDDVELDDDDDDDDWRDEERGQSRE